MSAMVVGRVTIRRPMLVLTSMPKRKHNVEGCNDMSPPKALLYASACGYPIACVVIRCRRQGYAMLVAIALAGCVDKSQNGIGAQLGYRKATVDRIVGRDGICRCSSRHWRAL
jgi:hypothetical protein